MSDDIFGGSTASGNKLDLPEAPYAFVRWNEKDARGQAIEHFDLEVKGPVVCYQYRQQWDNEKNKLAVHPEKLYGTDQPNPAAGQPKMETVHYVVQPDGSIVATSIRGLMIGDGKEAGPYKKAVEKAQLAERTVGMRMRQKYVKKDGNRRVFEFEMRAPDAADRDRVIPAHIAIVNHLTLVAAAYGGRDWLFNAKGADREDRGKLLEAIAKAATDAAKGLTTKTAVSVVENAVQAALPVALEAVLKGGSVAAAAPGESDGSSADSSSSTTVEEPW